MYRRSRIVLHKTWALRWKVSVLWSTQTCKKAKQTLPGYTTTVTKACMAQVEAPSFKTAVSQIMNR